MTRLRLTRLRAAPYRCDSPRTCRVCGCTDDDCTQCVRRTGSPCWWVEWNLCSACQGDEATAERAELEAAD